MITEREQKGPKKFIPTCEEAGLTPNWETPRLGFESVENHDFHCHEVRVEQGLTAKNSCFNKILI